MTELEKMQAGMPFNPSDYSFTMIMLKSEILQSRLNNAPLWRQKKRDRLFKKLVGSIDGRPFNILTPIKVTYGKNIYIGKNFFCNFNTHLQDYAEIHIGDNVFFGPNVTVLTVVHPTHPEERRVRVLPHCLVSGSRGCYEKSYPVHIGNDVIIYTGATICPGVTIGDNSIIGAGSVVTKDIPANVFACGVPCKVVREITEEDRIGIE